ncbi:MAG: hypothetical protein V3T22_00300 [Planctomycetota bacterium]
MHSLPPSDIDLRMPRNPNPSWALAGLFLLAMTALVFEPASALESQDGDDTRTRIVPTISGGGNADSNGSMIAVTGMDVTGQSILYLIDTESKQLCIYQASGGSSSTQGVKLVGARRIELDLMLDGFNDKTESNGKALSFKDLQRAFESQGHTVDDR